MRIAITGATGFIGSNLSIALEKNHQVIKISRQSGAWNPDKKSYNPELFKNLDAVIHLAGEGIANKLWSKKQKEILYKSRVDATNFLCQILKDSPPKVFICSSGIGYYGSRADETLDESSTNGKGFLAELSRDWEAAADTLATGNIAASTLKETRTIKLRLGMVLAKDGGALKKMLLPFKLGIGGRIGSGNQYISWVSLEDVISAIQFCINNDSISGPINLCAPNPETNQSFSKKLASALSRPCIFPLPGFVVKLIFGEMGEELLLSSTRARPEKLLRAGFKFQYENLEEVFRSPCRDVSRV